MPCITINFGIGQTEPTCENVLTCLLEVTHYDAINGIPKSHMGTVGYVSLLLLSNGGKSEFDYFWVAYSFEGKLKNG